MQVAVVDYGSGNLRSVVRALEYVGAKEVIVTSDPDALLAAERVVFPGQGAIGSCMAALQQNLLGAALAQVANSCVPMLGICIGLQVLFETSEEDSGVRGLGILQGGVRRFAPDPVHHLKIPHMGWNQARCTVDHPVWHGIRAEAWFYFVHSYFVVPRQSDIVAARTEYGETQFVSAVARDKLFAVQFHPEKSHDDGLRLLRNFLYWSGET
jgi:glutamine amidotransferase